jgi:hypothetical protein
MTMWRQGRLLDTPTTRRWTAEQRAAAEDREACGVYEDFSEEDQGRSRVLIAECSTREQAAEIVRRFNDLARHDTGPSGLVHRSMHDQAVADLAAERVERAALRERLGMARMCLDGGGQWKHEQAQNQTMRHLDCALAMLDGDTAEEVPT